MGRSALTVGISTYSYRGLKNLEAPARDAEAIAQQLEASFSPFRVERLPGVKDKANDGLKTGKTSQVTLRHLQEALVRYFKPRGTTYSDTVLFYFSGHGLYDDLTGKSYLATSDTNREDNKWGYALTDLSALLRDSPVKRQIIWLDCCHSGGLIAVKDANPGEQSGYSRCFVAASQEIESAYELTSGSYSVLTDGLLQGLNPERVPGQWIDTLSLCAFVNQYLKNVRKTYPQRSLFLNVGEPIDLTYIKVGSTPVEGLSELQVDVCPYRALNAFDFTQEDVEVFFGRTALTDELLAQIYEHNFLAVLGPSGSGKSSVVRAGLLYELQQGKRRSGTETWYILPIIRPGESPLRNLAGVFIPEILQTKKKGEALLSSSLSDLKARGAEALVDLIIEDYEQPVVLVVDQFEEIFTLCRGSQEKEQERRDFLDCLFGAVDTLAGQLRLVITLRADFLGKCLEQSYGNLAGRIKDCRVDITPLTDSKLDEVINKPAAIVGLQVAPYLQDRLKEHIKEAPGSLPLLEYALTELWRDWHTRYTSGDADVGNQLTFEGYDRIGGVAGALEKQANAVYESFAESTVKQGLVQRIFLELVQPGEETEDTRRQVLKRELISEIHPEAMLDEVLGKLVEARLVVTDEVPTENDPNAVVIELAHEATIRHWQQLRYWINKHRQDLPLIRQLRADAVTWQAHQQQPKYLLTGARLNAALDCVQKYRALGYFSDAVQAFVRISRETWIADEKEREGQILEALYMTAEVQWNQHQQLESLLTMTRAGKRLQQIRKKRPEIEPDNTCKVVSKLQQTLYGRIQEKNRLEGHDKIVRAITFSLNGKIFASTSDDQTVKLWNAVDGNFISTLQGHKDIVVVIAFNSNNRTLASAGDDTTVKLWNVMNGRLISNLEGHNSKINSLAFSPDGQALASASDDKTIRLWNMSDGQLVSCLQGHKDIVVDLVFSPDNRTLASASDDKTIKLWNALNGTLILSLEGHSDRVTSVIYSQDGKTLASGSEDKTVKIWKVVDGKLTSSLEGHNGIVNSVVYSPNGQILASASSDKTVKLWNMRDATLISSLEAHSDVVAAIVFSSDGKALASASWDKTIKIWNVSDGSIVSSLEGHDSNVRAIAFSPDGKTLASASDDKTIKFWDAASDRYTLLRHNDWVNAIAFSPDGKTLASASEDRTVKLCNMTDGSIIANLNGHDSGVRGIAYSPNGKILASASADQTVKLWDVVDGRFFLSLEGHNAGVDAVVYSPDGTTLASASWEQAVKLWDAIDGSLIANLEGHSARIRAVAYSPSGTTIATAGDDKTIKLWNAVNGRFLCSLEGHTNSVSTIAYSLDSKVVASADNDGTINLWNAIDETLIISLEEHSSSVIDVTYSLDGKVLISASLDKTVKFWNATNGSLISSILTPERVHASACSPNRKTLATVGNTNIIRLWNVADGSLISELTGHTRTIKEIIYSPDSKLIASASIDNTIRLWNVDFDLNFDAMMVRSCDWLRDYLTHNPRVSASDKKLLIDV
jgi:WD40 repeat protein/energy-coupling factor transporter ATP-binding protein EcfA2